MISDTHASSPLAPHAIPNLNDAESDAKVGAAMRPPQQEVWGARILDAILLDEPRPPVTIHLGDAANIACLGEIRRFFRQMSEHFQGEESRWYMAPGNHDTLIMGNFADLPQPYPPANVIPDRWNNECGAIDPPGSMGKASFFRDYLAEKGLTLGEMKSAESIFHDTYYECGEVTGDPRASIMECRGNLKEAGQYAWFLIQVVDIDEGSVLVVLDTTQYTRRIPSGIRGYRSPGGVLGGINQLQLDVAKALIAKRSAKRVVAAGHFPIESLDDDSKARLKSFLYQTHAVTYLSGHIHSPANARFHSVSGGHADWSNSTSDQ